MAAVDSPQEHPRVAAAWSILQEVRPSSSSRPLGCRRANSQVVALSSSALDDATTLYKPEPRENPAVRPTVPRLPPTLTPSPQLSQTTARRKSGRAAAALHTCQRRLSSLEADLRLTATDAFAARVSASRSLALSRLDDLAGVAEPWSPVSLTADAARVACQSALDAAHLAAGCAEERAAKAESHAEALSLRLGRAGERNAALQAAIRAADSLASDSAAALFMCQARESTLEGRLAAAERALAAAKAAAQAASMRSAAPRAEPPAPVRSVPVATQASPTLKENASQTPEPSASREPQADATALLATERHRCAVLEEQIAAVRDAARAAADASDARASALQQAIEEVEQREEVARAEARLLSRALAEAQISRLHRSAAAERVSSELRAVLSLCERELVQADAEEATEAR